MSQSNKLRQRGNGYYKSIIPGLSPVLKKSRLDEARKCYINALECSSNAKESASANKNIAMVSWKLASLAKELTRSQILFFYKEALNHFSQAFQSGTDAGNEDTWADDLLQKMYETLQESLDYVNTQIGMVDEKMEILSMACHLFPAGELKAQICVCYVEQLLGKAINYLQEGNFERSKDVLCDCYRPLEIARGYGKNNEGIMVEVDVFSTDVNMQIAVAEAKQALKTGDDLKIMIMMAEEELNIDMVWEVIDWYKKSILLTRELDVETEAIATSRIGEVYHSILKLKSKARPYLKNAITLTHSLHPRVLTHETWYKVCEQILLAYQVETTAEETAEWMKQRESTVTKLQSQIDKFKDIEDDYECLKYIYENHPPKNESHELPADLKSPSKSIEILMIKNLLQKAIIHYHPDNNSKEEHGIEWHVLCEEIAKVLTLKYNRIKQLK